MTHQLIVKDTVTGQCGLADPICPAVSTDPNNILILGTDGETFLDCSAIKGCETLTSLSYNSANYELTFTDENGDTTVVNLAALAADIFVTGATYDASTGVLTLTDNDAGTPDVTVNLAALISQLINNNDGSYTHTSGDGSVTVINVLGNEAGNLLTVSSNGGVSIIPSDIVSGICGDATAKAALVSCLEDDINTDTRLVIGSQTTNADGSIAQCFTTTAIDGSAPNGPDDVCFVIPTSASRMELSADGCTVQHFDDQNNPTGPALILRQEDQAKRQRVLFTPAALRDADLAALPVGVDVSVGSLSLTETNESDCRDAIVGFFARQGNIKFVNGSDGDGGVDDNHYRVTMVAATGSGIGSPTVEFDFEGMDGLANIAFPPGVGFSTFDLAAGASRTVGYEIFIRLLKPYQSNPNNRIDFFINYMHSMLVLK